MTNERLTVNRRVLRPDPNREPTYPGELLREDVLPAIGEPVMAVAKKLGVTRQHLHRVLAEKAPVTPDMALRLGKFCGNGPDLWLHAAGLRSLARRARVAEGGGEDTDREGKGSVMAGC